MFDQEKFNEFVIENKVLGFFDKPITLKSGRKSHWYLNWRTVSNSVRKMDTLTNFIIEKMLVDFKDIDSVIGVPEGATKVGMITQCKWFDATISEDGYGSLESDDLPLPMGRAKPKEHGDPKDRFFVGEPKGNVVVIEDVTTTGGSLFKFVEFLKELESVNKISVIALSNRNALTESVVVTSSDINKLDYSVEGFLKNIGIKYIALSEAVDLLPTFIEQQKPNEEIVESIKKEFYEHGSKNIKL